MGTVIVGVDGSETATEAAAVAARLAAAAGDNLVLVIAHAGTGEQHELGAGSDTWVMSDRQVALDKARQVAKSIGQEGLEVSAVEVEGRPAQALLAEAQRHGADLIVVGNRRMQGVGRLLGSVANEVAHNAPCDVYIAKTT
ncbi:MAG: universal stress protein [Actinomycetia bacterium]|nr:universal stress protein [Actinomycetes bacterium]